MSERKWHTVARLGNRTARLAFHLAGDHALERGLESASSDRIHLICKDKGSVYPPAARIPHHRRRQSWGT